MDTSKDDQVPAGPALEGKFADAGHGDLARNRLAGRLDADSLAKLATELHPVRLPARAQLSTDPVDGRPCCYFLSEGLASWAMSNRRHECIEVGMIGNEGVTGLPPLWSNRLQPMRCTMLVAGAGWKINRDALRRLCETTPSLESLLQTFLEALLLQVSCNLLAASRYRVEQRVARWLSLVGDRIGSPIPISHDMIAAGLGVRRAGVTRALNHLRDRGCITCGRREIVIASRQALTAACEGCYGVADVRSLHP